MKPLGINTRDSHPISLTVGVRSLYLTYENPRCPKESYRLGSKADSHNFIHEPNQPRKAASETSKKNKKKKQTATATKINGNRNRLYSKHSNEIYETVPTVPNSKKLIESWDTHHDAKKKKQKTKKPAKNEQGLPALRIRAVVDDHEIALCWANFRLRFPLKTASRQSPAGWRAHPGHHETHPLIVRPDIKAKKNGGFVMCACILLGHVNNNVVKVP